MWELAKHRPINWWNKRDGPESVMRVQCMIKVTFQMSGEMICSFNNCSIISHLEQNKVQSLPAV